ncbi:MAG TPA: tRNA (adenosine(37)-N6)-threonylcarbamoyltransferase complex ATPase subunit type 1 TsaE [Candidatus Saccharimonadales bacterium]|nr:tRNA (adenosine(37)-N6)-threonylcarbamoyltransferase complex ATPase subunit type 1 TsaE [Candidatus Saccharimonadales bacterium]
MSTALIWQTNSTSSEKTLELAEQIGRKLRGGEVIELVSDLGGGKTTFVHGLAAGMGSPDIVHSPSFTLSNEYRSDKLTLQHFDFYRLHEPGIMRDELAEILADPINVVAVEWADIVEDILPTNRLTIRIKTTGENERQISLEYADNLKYLVPGN